jgi:hypothetical protein
VKRLHTSSQDKNGRDARAPDGSIADWRRVVAIGLLVAWLCLTTAAAARAGDVRCWIDRGAIVVTAAYGPIAGDFILDLSQAKSQLHETATRSAGATDATTHWTLRLAGETRRGFPMTVADLDARIAGFPTNIAGILGADIIGGFTLDLDLEPCRVRLARRPPGRDPKRLRSRMVAGLPVVFAGISDGVVTRTGWFAIDTASAGSRLAGAGVSRALPRGVDPGDRTSPPARLRAVSVGGILLEQTPAGLMNAAPGLSGALGLSVWRRVHLHIAGPPLSERP